MADFIDIDEPDDGDTLSANPGIAAHGPYTADVRLIKVWGKVILGTDPIPPSPWEVGADEFDVNLPAGSGIWNVSGISGAVHGDNNRLVVWGGFSGNPVARLSDTLPEFIGNTGGGSGTASGSGIDEIFLVSDSCKGCGGVPRVLVATIERSQCEPLVGKKFRLRWNGELWKGLLKLPDGNWLTWRLEGKACKKCTPNHFRLSAGERKPQRPSSVCCNPFELEWKDKQAVKIGVRGSKIYPPGTTVEITVSQ